MKSLPLALESTRKKTIPTGVFFLAPAEGPLLCFLVRNNFWRKIMLGKKSVLVLKKLFLADDSWQVTGGGWQVAFGRWRLTGDGW